MIRSMTGYGRARQVCCGRDITVEIRSVNNRYLDCGVKLPRGYLFAEEALRARVQRTAARGKVDVLVTVDAAEAEVASVTVNRPLAAQYAAAIEVLAQLCGTAAEVTPWQLARFPEVLTVRRGEEDTEAVCRDLCAVADEALAAFAEMRRREGARLAADIAGHLDAIEACTGQIERRSPQTVEAYRSRLRRRMEEVLENSAIEPQRILQEAAIYADKVAVDEETVRLRSHLSQLRDMLHRDAPMGRKMDFLIQEVNREANTIAAKCCDVDIAQAAVELKARVEKIREQVQNVE